MFAYESAIFISYRREDASGYTNRIINLIQPAIDVMKNQAELTRLGKQYQLEVKLREFGRT